MKKILEFFKDDSGVLSMLRLLLGFLILVSCYMLYLFSLLIFHELSKTESEVNYTGLSLLFTTMFINFILALVAKIIQKKYEQRRDTKENIR